MKWVNALSTRASLEQAIREVVERAQAELGTEPDLAIVFISSAFASEFSRVVPLLREYLTVPHLLGCSGGGVVGVNPSGEIAEIEEDAALSLTLASLPGVTIQEFHISGEELPDLDSPPDRWIELVGVSPTEQPQFILLADPFAGGINDLLQGLDFAYPGAVKVGGLASSGSISNRSSLFCNDQHYQEGTIGLALTGEIVLEAIVAQGCRPIGQPYRVVEGERNVVLQLEDPTLTGPSMQTPLEILQALVQDLSDSDRQLAQENSLFVGIAQSEFKQSLNQGDFLIRNLLGVDPRNGAIAIGDRVRVGQRIQFHLRDAQTSSEDLQTLLDRYQQNHKSDAPPAVGALMFSCMGRGEGLYGMPNFDSHLFAHYFEQIPIGGFFCAGEIGPVGSSTFLHGYTSVFAICRRP
jgi:small ligand-binding sensory domain FIST